jgi:outer membrane lipoprotein-sorting protein
MTNARHMILTAALAVAFLSAGAFAQTPDPANTLADLHITVIAKTSNTSFAS